MIVPAEPDLVDPAGERGESLLPGLFQRAAARHADRVALEIPPARDRPERRQVTYHALALQARTLSGALSPLGRSDSIVAVLLSRTTEQLFAAQLGILEAGAAFACIDPSFPDQQVREILDDATPVAIITDKAGEARLRRLKVDLPIVRSDEPAVVQESEGDAASIAPHSLAYVIYTSGTTGRPKGVMIEHRSIASLVTSDLAEFALGPGDRVAQGSSAAYDSSVEETWLALAAGATLVVMDDDTARLGPDLVSWLRTERITVLCPPPTLLRTTGCADPRTALPHLRLLYVGGEALPPDVASRWAPGRRLENGYGPTECTVTALRTRIDAGDEITIGRPVPGMSAWVLNEAGDLLPEGEAGELCLGGIGLARGYHRRPELTAEKFPIHPSLGRIYRTGDLVRRTPAGSFVYLGRIDTQVKLRGYRVELEAIEARLAEIKGVREAACRVQGEGARQVLAAFIVPVDLASPPAPSQLHAALTRTLPAYMVPAHFQTIERLPRTVGGKVNRRALPEITTQPSSAATGELPRNALEQTLADVFRRALQRNGPLTIEEDFFRDLGGDSLSAAVAISLLREHPETAALTVRDLYECPTLATLAQRAGPSSPRESVPSERPPPRARRSGAATLIQSLWLTKRLLVGSVATYLAAFHLLPAAVGALAPITVLLLTPFAAALALASYVPLSVWAAVQIKRGLIGRYRATRAPVWGSFYVRNWIVQQAVRGIPWEILEGTEFQCMALRSLGARIGQRVHLHRGVDLLQGGWDLLEIGDDVTLSQDVCLRLVELEHGEIVVGPIRIGDGCTLETHVGVAPHTEMGARAYLTPWSSLPTGTSVPAGEKWDGIPARPAGSAPEPPNVSPNAGSLSPVSFGLRLLAARLILMLVVIAPAELAAIALLGGFNLDSERVAAWLLNPTVVPGFLLSVAGLALVAVPATVMMEAIACRAMGRIRPGVISRWDPAYIRVWLKTGLVDAAGRWLYGTLFWPVWLRAAGMRVGPKCEISGLIDTVPEMIEIGAGTFCADGIYLGGPRVHRGTVQVAPVTLGPNTFLGNGVVVPGGARLAGDVLVGVCTLADETRIRSGTAWFGHPPFQLPQRQVIACDTRLTHAPSTLRRVNRLFWELLRFTLPVLPAWVICAWFAFLDAAEGSVSFPVFLLVIVPAARIGAVGLLLGAAVLLKWSLLGRVRPGVHALWSCWASRWDFVCMAWSYYAPGVAATLCGTRWLNHVLRAMGVQIGHGVVLGGGFAQDLPDPDMLVIEDGATVDCTFQAHTFEDRVLKTDRVTIRRNATVGRNAVLLYGAEVGAGTRVAAQSVVMKHERLLPGRHYAGFPTRLVEPDGA